MMVPGSNLLAQAAQLIGLQAIVYLAWVERTKNGIGYWVDEFADPVTVKGSLQPVPRSLLETLGLDLQRNYVNIFLPQAVIDIARDVSGDQFQFAGRTYEALSLTPWFTIDKWNQVLCVEVPSAG